MIEVVTEEMHGSDRDSDLKLITSEPWLVWTYFYESEMALISEWTVNDRECAPEIAAGEDGAGVRGFHRRPHTKRTQDLRSERNMRIVRIIESAAYFQRLN